MKRCFLILFLIALSALLPSMACAEPLFAMSLPEDESVFSVCAPDGEHLALLSDKNVYRVGLLTGALEWVAARPESATELFASDDGAVYTVVQDARDERHFLLRLNADARAWETVAELPLQALDPKAANVMDAVFVGKTLYMRVYRSDLPVLLVSFEPDTAKAAVIGEFSLGEGTGNSLIATAEGVMSYDTARDGTRSGYLFICDATQKRIEKRPVVPNVDGVNSVNYDASVGMYWAVTLTKRDGRWVRSVYSGPALDQMAVVAEQVSGMHTVVLGGRCIVVESERLMDVRLYQNASGYLTLANLHTPYDAAFTIETGIITSTVGTGISDIVNRHNDQVDVVALSAKTAGDMQLFRTDEPHVTLSGDAVAIISPYSKRREDAIRYLEYIAGQSEADSYVLHGGKEP